MKTRPLASRQPSNALWVNKLLPSDDNIQVLNHDAARIAKIEPMGHALNI